VGEGNREKKPAERKGCLLKVRVQPGASRTEVKALMADGSVSVRLKAPPVEGRANVELTKLLCRVFTLPECSVKIVRGLTSRHKSVAIRGMSEAEAAELVARALESGERNG